MCKRWSEEKAWEWYRERPWIVGCNYVPSCCINSIEIWQEYEFDDVLESVKKELTIASQIGINSIRMIIPFFVWQHQGEGLKTRIDRFLSVCDVYGISLMPVFFDDCCVPKSQYKEPHLGKQPKPAIGHHGGVVNTPFGDSKEVGWHIGDDERNWPYLQQFVQDIVSTFCQDSRIILWDIWNEPGNSNRGNKSLPLMERAFEWAREIDPLQPLSAGPWSFPDGYLKLEGDISPIEKRALILSDVTTFHFYGDYDKIKEVIHQLRETERPLLITEWLNRPFGNCVETHLPLFKKEGIGCYHWGLVNGKTQTNEPWDILRTIPNLDLSMWQHDLFCLDGTPYSDKEIEIFKKLTLEAGNTR